jgi:hypothetical protein
MEEEENYKGIEREKMTLIYHHDDKCKWEHEETLVVPTLDIT